MRARNLKTFWMVALVTLAVAACDDQGSETWHELAATSVPVEAGGVAADPGLGALPAGTEVALTALTNPGWRFVGWEGPVDAPEVPVTSVRVQGSVSVTARFESIARGGDLEVPLPLDETGALTDAVDWSASGGFGVEGPAGLSAASVTGRALVGSRQLVIRTEELGEQLPLPEPARCVAAYSLLVPEVSEPIRFSSLAGENVGRQDLAAFGLTLTLPAASRGAAPGSQVRLYRHKELPSGEQAWVPVGRGLVGEAGCVGLDLQSTGLHALAVEEGFSGNDPDLGMQPLYDCVFEADDIIAAVSVVEGSTAEVLAAWVFSDISPEEMPETTEWRVQGQNAEPCMARLENHGKKFRLRSPYANRFSARYDTVGGRATLQMTGPYVVDPSGTPAEEPLPEPYEQCDRRFGLEVEVRVVDRRGDYDTFLAEVVEPLEEAYGPERVDTDWFRKLRDGYYAEVDVRTEACTRDVAFSTAVAGQEEVDFSMTGRLAMLVDRRNGGPYYAVNPGVTLRFIDPFWELVDMEVEEPVLGGLEHRMVGVLDLEYNARTDVLWSIQLTPEVQGWGVYRYDNPVGNPGDRPPDVTLPISGHGVRELYVDQAGDRLFVLEFDPSIPAEIVHIFGSASSAAPVRYETLDEISFWEPGGSGSEIPAMLVRAMGVRGGTLYVWNSCTRRIAPQSSLDGLEVFTAPAGNAGAGARFQGWAAFGDEGSGPVLGPNSHYNQTHDLLFEGEGSYPSAGICIHAIQFPAAWTSTWFDSPDPDGVDHWVPVQPAYRSITWPDPGTVVDLDVTENASALMAFLQYREDLNVRQVVVVEDAATVSGSVTPAYRIDLDQPSDVVEIVQPPPEGGEGG